MNRLIPIFTLLIGQSLFAQHHYGVKLGLGVSKSDKHANYLRKSAL